MLDKKVLTGITAAIAASLCCITPVLAVLAVQQGWPRAFHGWSRFVLTL